MKGKMINKIAVLSCAILMAVSFLVGVLDLSGIALFAKADTVGYFTGLSASLSEEALYNATNTYEYEDEILARSDALTYRTQEYYNMNVSTGISVSNSEPQITVLTHGLNGNASHWSNTNGLFAYDVDSLISRLANLAGGANIYWAKMESSNNFYLYDLANPKDEHTPLPTEYEIIDDGEVEANPDLLKVDKITDASKPIIIVFEANTPKGYNNEVYEEFNYMLSKIVYDVKALKGELLPKINLIGHSRGGITNLQYALDHPDMIGEIFSLGTPYFGSDTASTALGLKLLGIPIDANSLGGVGVNDITSQEVYSAYHERWTNGRNGLYKDIEIHALGGYSDSNFLLDELIRVTANGFKVNNMEITSESIEALKEAINAAPFFTISGLNTIGKITSFIVNNVKPWREAGYAEFVDSVVEVIADFECFHIDTDLNFWDMLCDNIVHNFTKEKCPYFLNDVLVDLSSQIGCDEETGDSYDFTVNEKMFREKDYGADNPKKLSNPSMPAVVHNLEARDRDFIDYIIENIDMIDMEEKQSVHVYRKITSTENSSVVLGRSSSTTTISYSGYRGEMSGTSFIVPSEIDGYTVTEISSYAFKDFFKGKGVTTVVIPATVQKIGTDAFLGCSELTTITFEGTSALTVIGEEAFFRCTNLTSLTIPSTVKRIEDRAFGLTGLVNVVLPESLEYLGDFVFANSATGSVSISTSNANYSTDGGILFDKNKTKLLHCPINSIGNNYTVPSTVEEIEAGAFYGNDLARLNLANVKKIGAYAFAKTTELFSITADNLDEVEEGAFEDSYCMGRSDTVIVGNTLLRYSGNSTSLQLTGVTSIASGAFAGNTDLESIEFPEGLKYIGKGALFGCINLTEIVVPNSVETIAESAFGGCMRLTKITLPFTGNTQDGTENTHFGYIFGANGYSSQNLYLPNGLTEVILTERGISAYSFYGCEDIETVDCNFTLTDIGEKAFYNCDGITSFELTNTVEEIGTSAFANSGLTSLTLPSTIDSIGASAFAGCSNLTKVYITGSEVISAGTNIFGASNNIQFIEVATKELLLDYRSTANWKGYKDILCCIGYNMALVTDDTEREFTHCFDYDNFSIRNIYDLSDSSWDYDDIEDSNVFGIVFFITTADGLSEISTGVGTTIPYEIVYGGEVSSSEASVTMIATDFFSMGYNVMTSYLGNSSVADEAYSVSETLGYYPVIVGDWRLKYNGSFMMGLSYALGVPVKVNLGEDGFSTEEFNMANAEVSLENWLFVDVYDSTFLTQLSGSGVNVYLYGCNKSELLANEDFCAEVYLVESRVDYIALMNEAYRNNQTFVIDSNWAFLEGVFILDSDLDDFYENGFEYACQELWELESYGLIDYNRWALLKSSYYAYPDSISSCVWVEQVVVVI